MSESSSPASFVPLVDSDSAPTAVTPAEPSLFHSWCGTRPRAIRCGAILLLVCGLVAVGLYFNFAMRPDRSHDPDREALCDAWVNRYHITPDGVANCPITTKLRLLYNDTVVPLASQLKTGTVSTRRPPVIELPAVELNHSYAFALLDIDFPFADNSSLRSKTHYLVVNIPGGVSPLPLHLGDTLFNYTAPCPLPRLGWHRYVAVLYDQHSVNNVSLAARNISQVPPAMMTIQPFLSALVGFDISDSLLGGTFFYGQFEALTCGLF